VTGTLGVGYYCGDMLPVDDFESRFRILLMKEDDLSGIEGKLMVDERKILSKTAIRHIHVEKVIHKVAKAYEEKVRHHYKDRPLPPLKLGNIYVVDDDDQFNAFACPNGDIVVFTGLIDRIAKGNSTKNKSYLYNTIIEQRDSMAADDTLSFVMAHEISHVILRHGNEKISNENFFCALKFFVYSLLTVSGFGGEYLLSFLEVLFYSGQEQVLESFLYNSYSRQMEREADRLGLLISTAACYDGAGARKFFELTKDYKDEMAAKFEEQVNQVENKSKGQGQLQSTSWSSTHPSDEERDSAIESFLPVATARLQVSKECAMMRHDMMKSAELLKLKKVREDRLKRGVRLLRNVWAAASNY
jgi:Zn-dependent protease with chaperone function